MLTPSQIAAQNTDEITDIQIKNLMLLVKQYPLYFHNLGLFPGLEDKLILEKDAPSENNQILKAVLAALDELPEVVVESQGRDTAPSHFTSNANWNSLALDVLNLYYSVPANLASGQSFALASPNIETLLKTSESMDDVLLDSLNKR